MNQGNEMTIEKDDIYNQVKEHQESTKDHSEALERVLELEVKVFRLGKKLESVKVWIVTIYIGLFIAFITDILR